MVKKHQIHLVAAARPNFMKIAPLYHALKKETWADPIIVHTGQHYDANMSADFFEDFNLPRPHIHLGVGSGSHAEQTGKVMIAYEKIIEEKKPSMVVVVGDVNSTMACTLSVAKMQLSQDASLSGSYKTMGRPLLAHLEAGLRSFDRTMPEEINRIVTDCLADYLWTPSIDGDENLRKEGIAIEKIEMVGNIMIDALEIARKKIEEQNTFRKFGFPKGNYAVLTLHRPSNVDHREKLEKLIQNIISLSKELEIVFPMHPRTRKNIESMKLLDTLKSSSHVKLTEPLRYIEFMNLVFNCKMVITDSGGIQEETTYLGIPCITIRDTTERPVTITNGTNRLADIDNLESRFSDANYHSKNEFKGPDLWDGQTSGRIVQIVKKILV